MTKTDTTAMTSQTLYYTISSFVDKYLVIKLLTLSDCTFTADLSSPWWPSEGMTATKYCHHLVVISHRRCDIYIFFFAFLSKDFTVDHCAHMLDAQIPFLVIN